MKYSFYLLFALAILSSACTKDDEVETENDLLNKELLELVNEVRASGCNCGSEAMPPVDPLVLNEKLIKAAQLHSEDMDNNNYFSHTSQNGDKPGDRITAQGYIWSTYGENIASGQSSAQQVMASWLKSEGHCRNIMNSSVTEFGAGRSSNYWTQVFGKQR